MVCVFQSVKHTGAALKVPKAAEKESATPTWCPLSPASRPLVFVFLFFSGSTGLISVL